MDQQNVQPCVLVHVEAHEGVDIKSISDVFRSGFEKKIFFADYQQLVDEAEVSGQEGAEELLAAVRSGKEPSVSLKIALLKSFIQNSLMEDDLKSTKGKKKTVRSTPKPPRTPQFKSTDRPVEPRQPIVPMLDPELIPSPIPAAMPPVVLFAGFKLHQHSLKAVQSALAFHRLAIAATIALAPWNPDGERATGLRSILRIATEFLQNPSGKEARAKDDAPPATVSLLEAISQLPPSKPKETSAAEAFPESSFLFAAFPAAVPWTIPLCCPEAVVADVVAQARVIEHTEREMTKSSKSRVGGESADRRGSVQSRQSKRKTSQVILNNGKFPSFPPTRQYLQATLSTPYVAGVVAQRVREAVARVLLLPIAYALWLDNCGAFNVDQFAPPARPLSSSPRAAQSRHASDAARSSGITLRMCSIELPRIEEAKPSKRGARPGSSRSGSRRGGRTASNNAAAVEETLTAEQYEQDWKEKRLREVMEDLDDVRGVKAESLYSTTLARIPEHLQTVPVVLSCLIEHVAWKHDILAKDRPSEPLERPTTPEMRVGTVMEEPHTAIPVVTRTSFFSRSVLSHIPGASAPASRAERRGDTIKTPTQASGEKERSSSRNRSRKGNAPASPPATEPKQVSKSEKITAALDKDLLAEVERKIRERVSSALGIKPNPRGSVPQYMHGTGTPEAPGTLSVAESPRSPHFTHAPQKSSSPSARMAAQPIPPSSQCSFLPESSVAEAQSLSNALDPDVCGFIEAYPSHLANEILLEGAVSFCKQTIPFLSPALVQLANADREFVSKFLVRILFEMVLRGRLDATAPDGDDSAAKDEPSGHFELKEVSDMNPLQLVVFLHNHGICLDLAARAASYVAVNTLLERTGGVELESSLSDERSKKDEPPAPGKAPLKCAISTIHKEDANRLLKPLIMYTHALGGKTTIHSADSLFDLDPLKEKEGDDEPSGATFLSPIHTLVPHKDALEPGASANVLSRVPLPLFTSVTFNFDVPDDGVRFISAHEQAENLLTAVSAKAREMAINRGILLPHMKSIDARAQPRDESNNNIIIYKSIGKTPREKEHSRLAGTDIPANPSGQDFSKMIPFHYLGPNDGPRPEVLRPTPFMEYREFSSPMNPPPLEIKHALSIVPGFFAWARSPTVREAAEWAIGPVVEANGGEAWFNAVSSVALSFHSPDLASHIKPVVAKSKLELTKSPKMPVRFSHDFDEGRSSSHGKKKPDDSVSIKPREFGLVDPALLPQPIPLPPLPLAVSKAFQTKSLEDRRGALVALVNTFLAPCSSGAASAALEKFKIQEEESKQGLRFQWTDTTAHGKSTVFSKADSYQSAFSPQSGTTTNRSTPNVHTPRDEFSRSLLALDPSNIENITMMQSQILAQILEWSCWMSARAEQHSTTQSSFEALGYPIPSQLTEMCSRRRLHYWGADEPGTIELVRSIPALKRKSEDTTARLKTPSRVTRSPFARSASTGMQGSSLSYGGRGSADFFEQPPFEPRHAVLLDRYNKAQHTSDQAPDLSSFVIFPSAAVILLSRPFDGSIRAEWGGYLAISPTQFDDGECLGDVDINIAGEDESSHPPSPELPKSVTPSQAFRGPRRPGSTRSKDQPSVDCRNLFVPPPTSIPRTRYRPTAAKLRAKTILGHSILLEPGLANTVAELSLSGRRVYVQVGPVRAESDNCDDPRVPVPYQFVNTFVPIYSKTPSAEDIPSELFSEETVAFVSSLLARALDLLDDPTPFSDTLFLVVSFSSSHGLNISLARLATSAPYFTHGPFFHGQAGKALNAVTILEMSEKLEITMLCNSRNKSSIIKRMYAPELQASTEPASESESNTEGDASAPPYPARPPTSGLATGDVVSGDTPRHMTGAPNDDQTVTSVTNPIIVRTAPDFLSIQLQSVLPEAQLTFTTVPPMPSCASSNPAGCTSFNVHEMVQAPNALSLSVADASVEARAQAVELPEPGREQTLPLPAGTQFETVDFASAEEPRVVSKAEFAGISLVRFSVAPFPPALLPCNYEDAAPVTQPTREDLAEILSFSSVSNDPGDTHATFRFPALLQSAGLAPHLSFSLQEATAPLAQEHILLANFGSLFSSELGARNPRVAFDNVFCGGVESFLAKETEEALTRALPVKERASEGVLHVPFAAFATGEALIRVSPTTAVVRLGSARAPLSLLNFPSIKALLAPSTLGATSLVANLETPPTVALGRLRIRAGESLTELTTRQHSAIEGTTGKSLLAMPLSLVYWRGLSAAHVVQDKRNPLSSLIFPAALPCGIPSAILPRSFMGALDAFMQDPEAQFAALVDQLEDQPWGEPEPDGTDEPFEKTDDAGQGGPEPVTEEHTSEPDTSRDSTLSRFFPSITDYVPPPYFHSPEARNWRDGAEGHRRVAEQFMERNRAIDGIRGEEEFGLIHTGEEHEKDFERLLELQRREMKPLKGVTPHHAPLLTRSLRRTAAEMRTAVREKLAGTLPHVGGNVPRQISAEEFEQTRSLKPTHVSEDIELPSRRSGSVAHVNSEFLVEEMIVDDLCVLAHSIGTAVSQENPIRTKREGYAQRKWLGTTRAGSRKGAEMKRTIDPRPGVVRFGFCKPGVWQHNTVELRNVGLRAIRARIRRPLHASLAARLKPQGAIAPGMSCSLHVWFMPDDVPEELLLRCSIEVVTEHEILCVPVEACVQPRRPQ